MAAKKQPPVSKGYTTTEFWMMLFSQVIALLWASGVIAPDGTSSDEKGVALAASILGSLGYAASRAKVKAAASGDDNA